MKQFFRDFKNFISKGNIFNLAIGVVLGTSFGQITTSLVNDIILPPIGALIGGVDFKDLYVTIVPAKVDSVTNEVIKKAVTWNYGNFIQTVINFLVIAFCLFMFIRLMMKANGFLTKAYNKTIGYKKVFTKEEIAKFKEEGKTIKEIQMLSDEKVRLRNEKQKALDEEKRIKNSANSNEVLLQDIRNMMVEFSKDKNLNIESCLNEDTVKYLEILEKERKSKENTLEISDEVVTTETTSDI